MKQGFILFFIIFLTACGFTLRGQGQLPEELKTVYIKTSQPYSEFAYNLRNQMEAYGVKVVDNPGDAQLIMEVEPQPLHDRVTSSSTNDDVQNYWLTYAVVFSVMNQAGRVLVPAETISVGRNYVANRDQVRSDTHEMRLIRQQMERDLVTRIFSRLQSEQIKNTLMS